MTDYGTAQRLTRRGRGDDAANAGALVAADLSGTVLGGRYRVLQLIGDGGMGRVYAADHVTLMRRLAVKVLRPELSFDSASVDRFLQEAQAASAIDNENVVDVIDFGQTTDGLAYFVMEFLEGEDLAARMDREGPMPWPVAQPIIVQIVRGLKAAHQSGVIHRDMKPANVFLTPTGGRDARVKLLDFGVAKLQHAHDRGRPATHGGMVFGTAGYMSPEQASGLEVDGRSDIYAVGVVLYEMLTGCALFDSDNFMEVIHKHLNEPIVPPRQRAPQAHIPQPVEDLLMRALAKEPDNRYQNTLEFEAAILGASMDSTVVAAHSVPANTLDRTVLWSVERRRGVAQLPAQIDGGPRMPAPVSGFATPDATGIDHRHRRTLPPIGWPSSGANPPTAEHSRKGVEGCETSEFALVLPKYSASRNLLAVVVAVVALALTVVVVTAWALFFDEWTPATDEIYPTVIREQPRPAFPEPNPIGVPERNAGAANPKDVEAIDVSNKVEPIGGLKNTIPTNVPKNVAPTDERERVKPKAPVDEQSPTRTRRRRQRHRGGKLGRGFSRARSAIAACGQRYGAKTGVAMRVTFDVLNGYPINVRVSPPHGATPMGRCVAVAVSSSAIFGHDKNAVRVSRRIAF